MELGREMKAAGNRSYGEKDYQMALTRSVGGGGGGGGVGVIAVP